MARGVDGERPDTLIIANDNLVEACIQSIDAQRKREKYPTVHPDPLSRLPRCLLKAGALPVAPRVQDQSARRVNRREYRRVTSPMPMRIREDGSGMANTEMLMSSKVTPMAR